MYLRWTNESALEGKQFGSMQPGTMITKTLGRKWSRSLEYGEAKPATRLSGDSRFDQGGDFLQERFG